MAGRIPEWPRANVLARISIIARVVGVSNGSPAPTAWLRMMFCCNVVMSGGEEKRSSHRWTNLILDRHKVGETVTAYYNPDDPSQAFLVKGDRGFVPYFLVGFGSVGLALAGVFANVAGHLNAYVVTVVAIAIAGVGWLAFQLLRAGREDAANG